MTATDHFPCMCIVEVKVVQDAEFAMEAIDSASVLQAHTCAHLVIYVPWNA